MRNLPIINPNSELADIIIREEQKNLLLVNTKVANAVKLYESIYGSVVSSDYNAMADEVAYNTVQMFQTIEYALADGTVLVEQIISDEDTIIPWFEG